MRKGCVFISLCFMMLFFTSCSEKIGVDGIENYQDNHSHYELNAYLLPSSGFIEEFEHIDIDYHYRAEYKTYFSCEGVERTLLVVEYGQEVYDEAKMYCLQNLQLSESNLLEYNDYLFVENIELAVKQERYGKASSFPQWFNMFAYNDDLRQLIFMGFYSPDYSSKDAQNVCDNWGEFIEKHFSDIYDWGQGDGLREP